MKDNEARFADELIRLLWEAHEATGAMVSGAAFVLRRKLSDGYSPEQLELLRGLVIDEWNRAFDDARALLQENAEGRAHGNDDEQ